ncbi:OsmC family protein [Candidatus Sumerlaeota bacterium]|nr:OsmC family protein [Candidatus Sumerlaeota bacterium]
MDMEISFSGGKKVNAEYKGFTIKTDQPPDYGGDGSAPEPFDLLWAAIGTCMGSNVVSFCQQRKIPTENIRLIQRMKRNADTKMVTQVDIEIQLPSDFPEKYRDAVVRAAEFCSVKKHLSQPPVFSIITSDASGESI